MIRSLEELLEDVKALGEQVATSDAGIALIENITDSMKAETITSDDLEKAKAEVEEKWRKKYVDRFYAEAENDPEPVVEEVEEVEVEKYEDLFEEKED